MNWKEIFDPKQVMVQEVKNPIIKSGLSASKYSANPYIGCPHACMYCYVPHMKGKVAEGRWGVNLTVKQWPPIPAPIARNYAWQKIVVGSVTDPYNPLEPHFKRTHALLEELRDSNATVSIITKSDLVLRDIDVLSSYDRLMVAISINTLDEKFKDDMDAAPSISHRLEALRCLRDAGIITSCFISPVFPGITDVIGIIEEVRNHCDSVWVDGLNLQAGNLGKVTGYISAEYSSLFPLYRRMFKDGDTRFWLEESARIKEYAEKQGMLYSKGLIEVERGPFGKPTIIDYLPRRVRY